MKLNPDLIELLAAFEKNSARYLIIGGYAVGFHAEPRYTKDCDFWIATDVENARAVHKTLSDFGAPLYGTTPSDFEGDNEFFWFGAAPNRIDIIMGPPGGVDFERAWKDRVVREYDGLEINYISRQHLIQLKRAANRDVDKGDIIKLIESDPDA